MLARSLVPPAFAVLAVGCQPPKQSEPPASPGPAPQQLAGDADPVDQEDEPLQAIAAGEFVLASPGVVLFQDEALTKPALSLSADSRPLALRVLEVHEGMLAVATQPEAHCGFDNPLRWAEVTLFMAESDAAIVTRRELTEDFPDGTRARLSAGVAVGRGTVHVDLLDGTPLVLPLKLPNSALGRSYVRHRPVIGPTDPIAKASVIRTASEILAVIGGEQFEMQAGTPVIGGVPAAGGFLVRVAGPCADTTIKTLESDIELPLGEEDVWGGLTGTEVGEAFGVGGLGLVGTGRRQRHKISAGAEVKWPSGEPAGKVLSAVTLDDPPESNGELRCFTPDFPKSVFGTPLCVAAKDVAEAGRGVGGFGKKSVPRVRQAKATVKGNLDKDIIRRIVRAHINEVRHCYNQGLVRDPTLAGRAAIQFTIGPDGKVPVAVVSKTDLKDRAVANCIAKAVKRWKFPKPTGGGDVVVTYPFVLVPG